MARVQPLEYDVVVIGGGLSGLCTAKTIVEGTAADDLPLRVAVLEASERLGGRNLTAALRGTAFDLGGQWVGPTQTAVLGLAKELKVETHLQYCKGRKVLDIGGRVSTYSSDIPTPLGLASLLDVQQLMWRCERMARRVDPAAPWDCPNAAEWDGVTVASKIRDTCWTDAGAALFISAVRGVYGVEPTDLSFLHFLAYTAAAGGFEPLVTITNGFQERTFLGGAMQLSQKLARRLVGTGRCDVYFERCVRGVLQDGASVRVEADNGPPILARRCVIALPPPSVSRIEFDPPLPAARAALNDRAFMGCIIKVLLLYDTPFWREAGLSGEVVCDCASGPAFNVYDDSLPRPHSASGEDEGGAGGGGGARGSQGAGEAGGAEDLQPALVVFINGHTANTWAMRTEEDRREAVLRQLVSWFGPQAAHPVTYREKNWVADPWTRGCPIGVWGPGALKQHGASLRVPAGRVHWAGTETSTVAMGFMEGAVRAGQRAGREVVGAAAEEAANEGARAQAEAAKRLAASAATVARRQEIVYGPEAMAAMRGGGDAAADARAPGTRPRGACSRLGALLLGALLVHAVLASLAAVAYVAVAWALGVRDLGDPAAVWGAAAAVWRVTGSGAAGGEL